jgi:DNA-directed RNA polymerase subunit RPC12/RpoP
MQYGYANLSRDGNGDLEQDGEKMGDGMSLTVTLLAQYQCDTCNSKLTINDRKTIDQAHARAIQMGWQITSPHTCPECVKAIMKMQE